MRDCQKKEGSVLVVEYEHEPPNSRFLRRLTLALANEHHHQGQEMGCQEVTVSALKEHYEVREVLSYALRVQPPWSTIATPSLQTFSLYAVSLAFYSTIGETLHEQVLSEATLRV